MAKTPSDALVAWRDTFRQQALHYRDAGYGHTRWWNRHLERLGITPIAAPNAAGNGGTYRVHMQALVGWETDVAAAHPVAAVTAARQKFDINIRDRQQTRGRIRGWAAVPDGEVTVTDRRTGQIVPIEEPPPPPPADDTMADPTCATLDGSRQYIQHWVRVTVLRTGWCEDGVRRFLGAVDVPIPSGLFRQATRTMQVPLQATLTVEAPTDAALAASYLEELTFSNEIDRGDLRQVRILPVLPDAEPAVATA